MQLAVFLWWANANFIWPSPHLEASFSAVWDQNCPRKWNLPKC